MSYYFFKTIDKYLKVRYNFAHPKIIDLLAQLVEQFTFNEWALGSNPR